MAAARPGDVLILTKPLGTGIINFAGQIGQATKQSIEEAERSMTTLNKEAARLMVEFGAHACTDVTGFGLMGHLTEMALSSGVDVEVVWDDIPLLAGVLEYAAAGLLPGAIARNKESCGQRVVPTDSLPPEMIDICYDAQTSGGLLIAIVEEDADKLLKALHKEGVSTAAVIGRIPAKGCGQIQLRTTGRREITSTRLAGTPVVPVDDTRLTIDKRRATSDEEVPCCADAVTSAPSGTAEASGTAEVAAKFKDFLSAASSPHSLDAYTKQAIAIAISVAMRCEPCLKMHLKNARKKGFTQDEIDEAAWLGISFGGSPTMVFYEQNK